MKSENPLDKLLSGAQAVITERAEVLEAIQRAELSLSEADQEAQVARERITTEEFQAAQKEGGLAVASKAAQQAVADAELKGKSIRLRLQGLTARRGAIETDLVKHWEALERFHDDFIQAEISSVSSQLDAAIESVLRGLLKMWALFETAGDGYRKRRQFCLDFPYRIFIHNPLECRSSGVIQGRLFSKWAGIEDGTLDGSWQKDEGGRKVAEAIEAMKDRLAPIGAVASQIRAKPAEN